ncbi:MAG: hypothetical protein JNL28_17700 [Planctomycetes bacterium]|nr:hypothetical protein [Planctomycetota bacterium]
MPLWLPLSLFLVTAIWVFDGMARGVEAAGYERIDPRASRLETEGAFCDPRWDDVMRRTLAALPPVSIHDTAAIERVRRTVAALPFVAGVGEASVIWPDSVEVPLVMRTPAACVMQGGEFLPVAEDGILLPGRWPTPPWIETAPGVLGYLPVIGPNDGAFDAARPGERLTQPHHLDALAVAISMRAALSKSEFEIMGPPLIDATAARLDPVAAHGVEIQLEGRRTIVFGRPPNAQAIGERPIEAKWGDVRRALEFLRAQRAETPGENVRDWSFLDVRWDTSDITWREWVPKAPAVHEEDSADRAEDSADRTHDEDDEHPPVKRP